MNDTPRLAPEELFWATCVAFAAAAERLIAPAAVAVVVDFAPTRKRRCAAKAHGAGRDIPLGLTGECMVVRG